MGTCIHAVISIYMAWIVYSIAAMATIVASSVYVANLYAIYSQAH